MGGSSSEGSYQRAPPVFCRPSRKLYKDGRARDSKTVAKTMHEGLGFRV